MAAELSDQLRSSLGSTYTIVRELGGGGMSRVFLATDIALHREVVIKVLLPELAAGVNAERFDREVQLSARLQHPHIVPVLAAGQVDGLPYYVMPYVKGESLRARLVRGPLPVSEAASIMSDVSKALAFAHSEQVVHRDIKPDNILLSGGAATVVDFGIAKALSSARQTETGAELTSLGTSLGTPAYMAPEQVAGDPDVDHRADIYSLGCVGYEMLTGAAPFAGKSPQQMLAAHVMETPTPIGERRDGVPASMIALVNRCMAKEPADRPQSAIELVGQLDGSNTHQSVPTVAPKKSRKITMAVVAGFVAFIAAISVPVYRSMNAPKTSGTSLTFAVAPFEVLDPRLALWKEGIVDVLSRNLDGSGPLRAIAPGVSIKKWEGHGDRTSAAKFGKLVGAQLVVYGQLQAAGADMLEAKVWIADINRDASPIEVSLRDSTSRMDRVTDSLSIKVLAAMGRNYPIGSARIASLGTGSLPAIKAFLQGAQHMRRSQWDSATLSYKEAVSIDSSFGIAYMQLAQAIGWRHGGSPEVSEANRRAGKLVRPGLSTRDSLLLTAVGHYANATVGGIRNFKEVRIAIEAARAATQRDPSDAEAWYLLGDFRYHNDASATISETRGYFDRAIAADSDYAQAYIHAIELAYRYGPEVGRRYSDAYLQRDPQDFDGQGVKLAGLLTDPKEQQQAVLKRSNADFSVDAGRKAYLALSHLPDSAEIAIQLLRTQLAATTDTAVRRFGSMTLAMQLAARGHISEAWDIAVKYKRYDVADIAALGLVPTDSAVKLVRPWLNDRAESFLIPIPVLGLARDTTALQAHAAMLTELLKRAPTMPQRPFIEYTITSLNAYAALAKYDTVTATRLFSSMPDTIVNVPLDELMQARLISKQDPQRALALLERLRSPGLVYTARELERGRIAERVGDRSRAVEAFAYVAAAWRNTDSPQLKVSVKEANDALLRLDADSRIRKAITSGTSPK